jgi:hypothetical protein
MKNLQKDLEPAGEQMTLFSQAGSRNYANHTAKPEKDLERKTSDTSGRKCLEQFERFNRAGLWAKTFSGLLIGTGDWYSTRCKLTWKLRGTKYNRMYFQLVPSTPPTDGTGFGLLPTTNTTGIDGGSNSRKANKKRIELLKTPGAMDAAMENMTSRSVSGTSGNLAQEAKNGFLLARLYGMLPTPTATDVHHADRVQALKETGAETMASRKNGANRPNGLMDYLDFNQMLCTPTAQASRGNTSAKRGKGNLTDQIAEMELTDSKTSQLNPRFVMEMMGFPPDWTILPFLNGEMNQLKPEETQ